MHFLPSPRVNFSIIFLSVLLDLVEAFPTPSNTITSTINTTAILGDSNYFKCFDGSFGWKGNRVATSDCTSAIFAFPRSTTPGTFHRGGALNDFQLPTERTHEKCTVSIDFHKNSTAEEKSSWLSLSFYAHAIATACDDSKDRTSGAVLAGDNYEIVVRLGKKKEAGDQEVDDGLGIGAQVVSVQPES